MYCIEVVRNSTKLTLTERNQKLYELRVKLDKARAQVAWIEQEIWLTRDAYERQHINLYEEMFGDVPVGQSVH